LNVFSKHAVGASRVAWRAGSGLLSANRCEAPLSQASVRKTAPTLQRHYGCKKISLVILSRGAFASQKWPKASLPKANRSGEESLGFKRKILRHGSE